MVLSAVGQRVAGGATRDVAMQTGGQLSPDSEQHVHTRRGQFADLGCPVTPMLAHIEARKVVVTDFQPLSMEIEVAPSSVASVEAPVAHVERFGQP